MQISFHERIEHLRKTKESQTREKQEEIGSMDHDDWGLVLPPPDKRRKVETMSSSGMPINDILLKNYEVEPNHPSGGFFGPRAVGRNYKKLLEVHPIYIDPMSSLAGAYMVNFMSYRDPHWNPDLTYEHLEEEQEIYQLVSGIGATQHFCQDLEIGLKLGWGGILAKIRKHRKQHSPEREDFYAGCEDVVLGIQDWIGRTAETARSMAAKEKDEQLRENLQSIARINHRLITEPPSTFREACQWILWYLITARMYNGSGSCGKLDKLLYPFYRTDVERGRLTEQEAVFHIACLLLRDTAYIQLGGPDKSGEDVTNEVSFLVLDAAHRLRIPANIGVCVGDDVERDLFERGIEVLFEDTTGIPKFLGIDNTIRGFMRNGYSKKMAQKRAYSGCHWFAIPGREYGLMDCVKVNFAAVFNVAMKEMMHGGGPEPSTDRLWRGFVDHLQNAVQAIARGLDFHLEHMHDVFPELVLDLCCHGPIERGRDASNGGVDHYNMCVDGAALATVADSFAAVEQRVEKEGRLGWGELEEHLSSNWSGPEGEKARLLLGNIPRYGSGNSRADLYAERISRIFTETVKERRTPSGHNMIPGIFSWANTIPMGNKLRATPNGRRAGDPISHGANPDPGFREDGAVTALMKAVAGVQCGYGNTVPVQVELAPDIVDEERGLEYVMSLIETHFELGGTMVNINVLDEEKVLAAHENPEAYPDLVVRVTGFSAYFSSLSEEFRQMVVDRIISN